MKRTYLMREDTWERHANPWSVWTRAATLPFLYLAVWSHLWIGGWFVLPLVGICIWLGVNPGLFPRPRNTETWSSKCTFGERLWARRKELDMPAHFSRVVFLLQALAGGGFLLGLIASWRGAFWPMLLGLVFAYLGKFWFLDRMVWLFELQVEKDPKLQKWVRKE